MSIPRNNLIAMLPALFILIHLPQSLPAQVWWEDTGQDYGYDLAGKSILILVGDDFDYHETMIVKEHWERWGARVDIAGTDRELTGHLWKRTPQGWDRSEERTITTGYLLTQVNLSAYQALFFPGGNSPRSLLDSDSLLVVGLIQQANRKKLVLAAICHGPQALSAAGVVRGRRATGHPDVIEGIRSAGGEYVTEVCVTDRNIITGNWPYFETMAASVAEKLLYPRGGGPLETSPFKTQPVLRAIKERRSVRAYQDKEVDQQTVDLLLSAASWAPSANNDQPWRFVVVRDRETKDQIQAAIVERILLSYTKRGYPAEAAERAWGGIFSAPVHIFAFCDTAGVEVDPDWEEIDLLHSMQGVSLACQNILLAAEALELGSLWAGAALVAEEEIKTLLKVPEHTRLVTMLAIGYPAYKGLPPVRKRLDEIRFHETWGAHP